ncbi:putative TIR domain, P-loop containing nucleoside triphosphate hydrolase [Helianthus annuus]|nr:putative TIR domain, P-loop containing nucleoside triphosphate hydrolase [Helianthus annuus]
MASSSSSVHNKSYLYDVFLSFSGEDTRKTFVDHLYVALDQHGIRTFKDDERLEIGKKINNELLQSIEDSRVYIIVFSKKYASSSWCLSELLKIMECHNKGKRFAFPVFYHVDPSEVRKQTGSVGEALANHTDKDELEVRKWREALKEAANLSGLDVSKTANGHEAKVIKLIVEQVSLELRSINTGVDENLVGMEQRMQALDPYLEIGLNYVRMVGIKGVGGIGKTTLAHAIFDKLTFNFEGISFVENVREKASRSGLEKLQEQVLRDVLKDKGITVSGVHEGIKLMKTMLLGKKVLLVLDDVDQIDQLEALAGNPNWFKLGSRIIITSRDEKVLISHRVKCIHDVTMLPNKEAIRLFRRHAFREDVPAEEYEILSLEIVRYADGLPLTIKVLGSKLCGKDISEWTYTLEKLKTIKLNEPLRKLELSYESLLDNHKEIFLDVACFLQDGKRGGIIGMHDHLVEMGKNIVRREHPDEPNKHSRLWIQEKIEHVLAGNSGSEATRCVDLKITRGTFLEGLGNMKELRCLIVNHGKYNMSHDLMNHLWNIPGRSWKHDKARWYFPNSLRYLYWEEYPHLCLPKTFEANNLVALEMRGSKIEQLWEGEKVMEKLRFLNLSNSKLRSLDLRLTPNLERLILHYCKKLVALDVHGGCLKSLVYLNLNRCESLKSISFIQRLESLEVLHLSYLDLKEFPDYIITEHSNNSLLELHLSRNKIEEIPSSIGNLNKLVFLYLSVNYKIKSLPGNIWSLRHLRTLNLSDTSIEELPEDNLGQLECLEELDLIRTKVKHLPGSICMLKHLKTLLLRGCRLLEKLPEDVGQLESLEILDLGFCFHLREIPNSICKLNRLKELRLENCRQLKKLPDELGNLKCLQLLSVWATGITQLPQSISTFKGLKTEIWNGMLDNFKRQWRKAEDWNYSEAVRKF